MALVSTIFLWSKEAVLDLLRATVCMKSYSVSHMMAGLGYDNARMQSSTSVFGNYVGESTSQEYYLCMLRLAGGYGVFALHHKNARQCV